VKWLLPAMSFTALTCVLCGDSGCVRYGDSRLAGDSQPRYDTPKSPDGDAGAHADGTPSDAKSDTNPDTKSGTLKYAWGKRLGGSGNEWGHAVAVDSAGNISLLGSFEGQVDFGGGVLTSAGSGDIYLVSFTRDGAYRWSKRFGSTSDDWGYGIAVDSNGHVFITGGVQGTVDFGGGPLTSAGGHDIFLAGFTSAGAHLWSKLFGGAAEDVGMAVAVDSNGFVTMTGYFTGALDFGGGLHGSAGGGDAYVASFTAGGVYRWAQYLGGTGDDAGNGVAATAVDVAVTGRFTMAVDFGGGALTSAGGTDAFLVSFSSTGTHQWSKRLGGTSNDGGYGVAIDSAGNVFATGYVAGRVDLGSGQVTVSGTFDAFLSSYSKIGTYQWSKVLGGTAADLGLSLAVDAAGTIFLAGDCSPGADFGGGALNATATTNILVAEFWGNGAHRWSKAFGNSGVNEGYGIALDGVGGVVVTGLFANGIDLGGGLLTSAGSNDVVLLRLSP
jgi:hypothetical protein